MKVFAAPVYVPDQMLRLVFVVLSAYAADALVWLVDVKLTFCVSALATVVWTCTHKNKTTTLISDCVVAKSLGLSSEKFQRVGRSSWGGERNKKKEATIIDDAGLMINLLR